MLKVTEVHVHAQIHPEMPLKYGTERTCFTPRFVKNFIPTVTDNNGLTDGYKYRRNETGVLVLSVKIVLLKQIRALELEFFSSKKTWRVQRLDVEDGRRLTLK